MSKMQKFGMCLAVIMAVNMVCGFSVFTYYLIKSTLVEVQAIEPVVEHVNICEAINMEVISASCKVYNDGEQECTYECLPVQPNEPEGEYVL